MQQPIIQSHGGDSVLTVVAGTTFVNLADHICNEVTIVNPSVDIDILPFGSDPSNGYVTAASGSGLTIPISGNAQELGVRRNDQTGTPTRIRFLYRKWLH